MLQKQHLECTLQCKNQGEAKENKKIVVIRRVGNEK